MTPTPMWRRYLRFLGNDPAADVEDELDFHMSMRVDDLMRSGLPESAAAAQAAREFGDVGAIRRQMNRSAERRARRSRWADNLAWLRAALKLSLRRLRKEPLFTSGVVLAFTLGIGANATVFGILDRLLLSPPSHVVDAENVRRIVAMRDRGGEVRPSLSHSYPDFVDIGSVSGFTSTAAIMPRRSVKVGRGIEGVYIWSDAVSGAFFSLLGVQPAIGRFFGPSEDAASQPSVAVLGYDQWQTRYGGDAGVIGKTIDFGYGPYEIIGVAPRGFTGIALEPVDLWVPLNIIGPLLRKGCLESRECYSLQAVGRIGANATPASVEAEATAALLNNREGATEPPGPNTKVVTAPLLMDRGPFGMSGTARLALWLAGISLFVLLIACSTIANLILSRLLKQQAETGVRLALGSSRRRLIAQVFTETLLLAFIGAAGALLITRFGSPLLWRTLLPDIVWDTPDGAARLGVVVGIVAIFSATLAAAVPAIHSGRLSIVEVLKTGRNKSRSVRQARIGLIVVQSALTLVLLVGADLFVRSLRMVAEFDYGIKRENVLRVWPYFEPNTQVAQKAAIFAEAADRLRSLPGVEAVSQDVSTPLGHSRALRLQGSDADSLPSDVAPALHAVDQSFARLTGLEIRRGRWFTAAESSSRVAVVEESLAGVLWPGGEPLGKCLYLQPEVASPCFEVVGVAGDIRNLSDPLPYYNFYVPFQAQSVDSIPSVLLVQVDDQAPPPIETLRREVFAVDPTIEDVAAFPLDTDLRTTPWYIGAMLFSVFGALALLLAGMGLYSVLAYNVAQRSFEFGVRRALGARSARLLGSIVGNGLALVGLGILIGLPIAFAAAPRVQTLLYEQVAARNPVTFWTTAALLLLVGLVASVIPTSRALRIDPSAALRAE